MSRLVLSADDTSLEAVCYSFADVKRNLKMRLCRLKDGRYRVSLHSDPEGSGKAGEILWKTERDIRRFDIVSLPIPSRIPLVIKVEQIKKYDRPAALPDLVVDPWDAKLSGKNVSVKIHNIGNAPSKNIVVRLVDGENTFAESIIENIDPPIDFVAKRETVTFDNVPYSKDLKVIVDPDNVIREIMEENNEAAVTGI